MAQIEATNSSWNPYPQAQDAAKYDEISTVQQQWALSTLGQCAFLKDAHLVLDVGCGTGIVTADLARRVTKGSVIGLDVSEPMVRIASEKFKHEAKLTFHVADALHLPYQDACFDAATAFCSLNWLDNPKDAVNEMHRVLAPKGKIVIVTPDTSPNSFPLSQRVGQAMGSVFGSAKWRERFATIQPGPRFTKETVEGYLNEAGFENVEVKSVQEESVFKNREEIETWIYSSFTLVRKLSNDDHRWELAKEITTKWLEIFKPEEDGKIKLIGAKLQAVAEKRA